MISHAFLKLKISGTQILSRDRPPLKRTEDTNQIPVSLSSHPLGWHRPMNVQTQLQSTPVILAPATGKRLLKLIREQLASNQTRLQNRQALLHRLALPDPAQPRKQPGLATVETARSSPQKLFPPNCRRTPRLRPKIGTCLQPKISFAVALAPKPDRPSSPRR